MKTSTFKTELFSISSGILTLFLIIFLISHFQNNILFPPLGTIFLTLGKLLIDYTFIRSLLNTLLSVFLTLIISYLTAMFFAMFEIKFKAINKFISPFIFFIKCAPLVIISIYLYLLFGNNTGPYFIIFAATFPIIYDSFITSINEISINITNELALTRGSFIIKYFKIYLPLIMPYTLSSLIISIGIGFKASIMGEYLMNTENSLGYLIYDYKTLILTDELIAILLFCILFSLVIEFICKYLIKLLKNKVLS